MGKVYSVEYPPDYTSFEKTWFSWLGLNLISEIECYKKITFLNKLSIAVLGPTGMVGVIIILSWFSTLTTRDLTKKKERTSIAILACILVTFVLLPSISLVVFQCFSCDEETNTLHADSLVICEANNADFTRIRSLGWLGFFLYPFGVSERSERERSERERSERERSERERERSQRERERSERERERSERERS